TLRFPNTPRPRRCRKPMSSCDVTLTREQLYQFVWNEPIRTVAVRYGLSDRGLAKICMRLNVPVPGRGYWQQKAVGKAVSRPRLKPLAPTASPQEQQITLGGQSSRSGSTVRDSVAGRQAVVERAPDHVI